MKGYRKLLVIILYMACATLIAVLVVTKKYDTLAGAGLFAGGLASGVAAFAWSNAKEHAAQNGDKPQA